MTLKGTTGAGLAKAVMSDQGMYLVANGLPPNDRSRSIYVLWAANAQGRRRAVVTFDVRDLPGPDAADKLPFTAAQIRQLAISYEPGRRPRLSPPTWCSAERLPELSRVRLTCGAAAG